MDPKDYPAVPADQRPKLLYVDCLVGDQDLQVFTARGWEIVDVRLLPSDTDADRANAWRAYMEGVRQKSIEPDPKKLKFLEMEGRSLGLLATKGATREEKPKLDKATVDNLLTLTSPRAFVSATVSKPEIKAKKGRGFGAKTKRLDGAVPTVDAAHESSMSELPETDGDGED